jgi:hypothetical protein
MTTKTISNHSGPSAAHYLATSHSAVSRNFLGSRKSATRLFRHRRRTSKSINPDTHLMRDFEHLGGSLPTSKKANSSTVFEQAPWIEDYTTATNISALTRPDFMKRFARSSKCRRWEMRRQDVVWKCFCFSRRRISTSEISADALVFLQRPAMKQRCPVTNEKQEKFIRQVQPLLEAFPRDRVINIDETNRRVVAAGFWTWADTGSGVVSYQ